MGDYSPNIILRNAHLNTIYPVLFRWQRDPHYTRRRFQTPDDDFVDVDFRIGSSRRLAILLHGLEGSSSSKYIIGTGELLSKNNWDVAALNHRSCSGEMNKQKKMYHSGATDDLALIIDQLIDDYEEIVLIGYSLGGNMALKYGGERADSIDERISAIVGISVPTDLKGGSFTIGKISNYIYEHKFMVTLKEKMRQKAVQFPDDIDLELLKDVNKLYDFDDYFTGPINGFKDADDYYTQCSSQRFIPSLKVPSMLINALDDPFLSESCFPFDICAANDNIEFLSPKYGGHVGFASIRSKYYWNERTSLEFVNSQSKLQELNN